MSTSMVYLFRSLGTVWGVAASSTIIQNVLTAKLPEALAGVPEKEKVLKPCHDEQNVHSRMLTI